MKSLNHHNGEENSILLVLQIREPKLCSLDPPPCTHTRVLPEIAQQGREQKREQLCLALESIVLRHISLPMTIPSLHLPKACKVVQMVEKLCFIKAKEWHSIQVPITSFV